MINTRDLFHDSSAIAHYPRSSRNESAPRRRSPCRRDLRFREGSAVCISAFVRGWANGRREPIARENNYPRLLARLGAMVGRLIPLESVSLRAGPATPRQGWGSSGVPGRRGRGCGRAQGGSPVRPVVGCTSASNNSEARLPYSNARSARSRKRCSSDSASSAGLADRRILLLDPKPQRTPFRRETV